MLVLEGVVVDVLQLVQQVGDGGGRADGGPHRHGVDQQPHHGFRADQLGGPARDGGAEGDIVLAGQPAQKLRPGALQHGADGGVARPGQLAHGPGGVRGHPEGGDTAPPRPPRWAHQRGGLEPVQHLAPGRLRGIAVLVGEPGQIAAIRRGRGQPLPVVAGEDFLQQDRQRPAIDHDVVQGQHEPVPIRRGADQRRPEGRLVEVADRRAFGGAYLLNLLVDVVGIEFFAPPRHDGVGRDDLHRLTELVAEAGHQVRVPVDHRLHRLAQPARIQRAGHGDPELHRIEVVAGTFREADVKEQSLLHGGQRQHVGDLILPLQLVDVLLGQPGRGDVRRRQAAPTGSDMRADAGQGVKPQLAQPADLLAVQRRGRPGPVRL